MAQPIDIISRALKDIGALEAGESPTADAAQDGLDLLNDMLDQWSNEDMMVYNYTEIVFPVVQNQTQYTIGPTGDIGSNFTGYIVGDILTVTGVNSGSITLNQLIDGVGNGITAGTSIISFLTGAGGIVNANGTYKLNISQPSFIVGATSLVAGNTYIITEVGTTNFTLVGAPSNTVGTIFLATGAGTGTGKCNVVKTISGYYQKPLGINSAFVRVNTNSNGENVANGGLDYPIAVLGLDQYELIGLKTLNGPWPKALYYNPGDVLGNLFVWPNPSQGEVHLFTNTIFTRFESLYQTLAIPQGYSMALRWCLAERMMPMYGKNNPTQIAMINAFASQGKATLKRTNMRPQQVARYDEVITSSKSKDAGWILSGGFFR
jgi:hypothetical protein